MSLQVVQPMLFINRGYCPIGHLSSLPARFSANFRDFPNYGASDGWKLDISAGAAGFSSGCPYQD